ncbi:MAG: RraA family protein [Armatimonadetes bacterium]|nr:RraA family protein [Armatimonadota bacterium]
MSALAEQLCRCSSSSVSDALDESKAGRGGVIEGLRVLGRRMRAAGPIETVLAEVDLVPRYPVEDFTIGQQIHLTKSGSILFIDAWGKPVSNWGGLATRAAMLQGLAACVIRGGARDAEEIEEMDFLLATAHVTPRTGKGRIRFVDRGAALQWGDVRVEPGDWAMADRTGIVVLPAHAVADVARRAAEMEAADDRFVRLLDRGLGFDEARRQVGHF